MQRFFSCCVLFLLLTSCGNNDHNSQALTRQLKQDSLLIDSLSNLPAARLQQAIYLENTDPLKATLIYRQIKQNDSTSYLGRQADSRLRFLEGEAARKEFIKKIADDWKWEWKGTNWGPIEIPKPGVLERQLVIKENGEIEFYENNKLVRRDSFEIRNPNLYFRDKYLIELKQSKEIFSLWYNSTRLTLSEPDCKCGCVTNEYYRKWKRGV